MIESHAAIDGSVVVGPDGDTFIHVPFFLMHHHCLTTMDVRCTLTLFDKQFFVKKASSGF